MAKAGFDPQQSINLWQNMAKASGGDRQPELLSTHPLPATRIKNLTKNMPNAIKSYRLATTNLIVKFNFFKDKKNAALLLTLGRHFFITI